MGTKMNRFASTNGHGWIPSRSGETVERHTGATQCGVQVPVWVALLGSGCFFVVC